MEVQMGGMKNGILEFIDKSRPTQVIFLYILVTLMIVFKEQIPASIYNQLDTSIGRLFILVTVVSLVTFYNWILGLLAAVAFTLLIGLPHPYLSEGFGSGGETSLQVVPTSKKWFVEKVFGENPIAIEEEKVVTSPVQNDSPGNLTGGVQNTSVQ